MSSIKSSKKLLISFVCAIIFIMYVPSVCMLNSSLHEDIDHARAEEIAEIPDEASTADEYAAELSE